MKSIVSILALAAAASLASAGSVTVSGAANGASNGNFAVLSSTNLADSWSFNFSNTGVTVRGLVQVSNTFDVSSNQHVLTLVLTQMQYTSSLAAATTIQLDIVQDYLLNGVVSNANASHQLNGFTSFAAAGQSASIVANSTHETTALSTLNYGATSIAAGNNNFFVGDGAPRFGIPVSGLYRIAASTVFTITAGTGGAVTINLPDSQVDNASIVLVPLPPAAFAGLGGLALVGLGAQIRRRRLAQA
jgi:hypothetical protein